MCPPHQATRHMRHMRAPQDARDPHRRRSRRDMIPARHTRGTRGGPPYTMQLLRKPELYRSRTPHAVGNKASFIRAAAAAVPAALPVAAPPARPCQVRVHPLVLLHLRAHLGPRFNLDARPVSLARRWQQQRRHLRAVILLCARGEEESVRARWRVEVKVSAGWETCGCRGEGG